VLPAASPAFDWSSRAASIAGMAAISAYLAGSVIIRHENQRFSLAMLIEIVMNGTQPHVMLRCCDC
jgi:hypothetical protein